MIGKNCIVGAGALVTGGTFALVPGLEMLDVPFFVGPVNGIVVAMATYVAAYRLTGGERFAGGIAFARPTEPGASPDNLVYNRTVVAKGEGESCGS